MPSANHSLLVGHRLAIALSPGLLSGTKDLRVPSECGLAPRRHNILNHWTRAGLVFWCQRRRRLSSGFDVRSSVFAEDLISGAAESGVRTSNSELKNPELICWPPGHRLYEDAIRCRQFRLAKPGGLERERHSLLANGNPDWNREPWKRLKRSGWTTWPRPKDRPWS